MHWIKQGYRYPAIKKLIYKNGALIIFFVQIISMIGKSLGESKGGHLMRRDPLCT